MFIMVAIAKQWEQQSVWSKHKITYRLFFYWCETKPNYSVNQEAEYFQILQDWMFIISFTFLPAKLFPSQQRT